VALSSPRLVDVSYRKVWHALAQPGRGRNRTKNRRNIEMQKHKITKRTHFPHFSSKNAHSQNEPIFSVAEASLLRVTLYAACRHSTLLPFTFCLFVKTNPFYLCGSLYPCGKKTKRTQISIFQSKTHFCKTNPFFYELRTKNFFVKTTPNLSFDIWARGLYN
jgi:hypothetical protein